MKYKDFDINDNVLVAMPMKSLGFNHPQNARVVGKGRNGIVLFEKPNGRRWWANSRRIVAVESLIEEEIVD